MLFLYAGFPPETSGFGLLSQPVEEAKPGNRQSSPKTQKPCFIFSSISRAFTMWLFVSPLGLHTLQGQGMYLRLAVLMVLLIVVSLNVIPTLLLCLIKLILKNQRLPIKSTFSRFLMYYHLLFCFYTCFLNKFLITMFCDQHWGQTLVRQTFFPERWSSDLF